jgi:hypothetical protein
LKGAMERREKKSRRCGAFALARAGGGAYRDDVGLPLRGDLVGVAGEDAELAARVVDLGALPVVPAQRVSRAAYGG